MRLVIASLGVAAAAAFGTAVAQPAQPGGSCRPDIEKFCKDVAPGKGAIARCLVRHETELSPACRESVAQGRQRAAQAKQRAQEFAEVCRADADKLCQGVQPGQGRIAGCLVDKKAQLSPGCRQAIEDGERRQPCFADVQRLCKDVKPGEGRIAACMTANEARLSAECKADIAQKRKRAPR